MGEDLGQQAPAGHFIHARASLEIKSLLAAGREGKKELHAWHGPGEVSTSDRVATIDLSADKRCSRTPHEPALATHAWWNGGLDETSSAAPSFPKESSHPVNPSSRGACFATVNVNPGRRSGGVVQATTTDVVARRATRDRWRFPNSMLSFGGLYSCYLPAIFVID